jgi:hypothetical protein
MPKVASMPAARMMPRNIFIVFCCVSWWRSAVLWRVACAELMACV